ncbi:MAG: hypothetical protein DI536_04130 [Archangium gephyra]|uniref:KaiC-like domain-containing protein n=1 Tax=Archangium gephyra TaxID=48 RepID=A0A2W5V7U3_9BACT|nr:MAG: hypothetical protein DI536_04130 [Archangium gephyra]
MSAANVVQLPTRVASKAFELEPLLIGAALHLRAKHQVFEVISLVGDEFAGELHRKAWQIARARAERNLEVSAAEVFAAGLRKAWFQGEERQALERLEAANMLDAGAFIRVARDFRNIIEGQRFVQSLEAAVLRVRQRGFDPATEAGWLSGVERSLHAHTAKLEPLTVEQEKFLSKWESNEQSGKLAYLPTGIRVLDEAIGGLPRSLTLIVADAGVGKTAFQDSLLHALLVTNVGIKAALISPEDGTQHVVKRWMARDMGWVLRDVGSRKRNPIEEELSLSVAKSHYPLLERVLGYTQRNITADKLISTLWQAADAGAEAASIDNFNKLNISGLPGEYPERVQRFSDRLQEFSEKSGVAAIMLAHSTDDVTSRKQVSGSAGVQGGKSLGRDARLRLDLYQKDHELRCVIAKANELGEQGTVLQFHRLREAGLIDPEKGFPVDVKGEEAAEQERAADARLARQMALTRKRKKLIAQEKAATEDARAEAEAQASLFDAEKQAAVEKPKSFGMRWATPKSPEDSHDPE